MPKHKKKGFKKKKKQKKKARTISEATKKYIETYNRLLSKKQEKLNKKDKSSIERGLNLAYSRSTLDLCCELENRVNKTSRFHITELLKWR